MAQLNSPIYRTLGAWRRAQKFNQQRAAKVLGLSQSYYSKLERRVSALPGRRAKKIAKQTTVPLEVLVCTAA